MQRDKLLPNSSILQFCFAAADSGGLEDVPDFSELFADDPDLISKAPSFLESEESESSETERFKKNPKITSDTPHNSFSNADYYKAILNDEGEIARKLHGLIAAFLKATDSQERSTYRSRLGPAYWELASKLASKTNTREISEKRLALRFGLLVPTMIDKQQRQTLSTIPLNQSTNVSVYYVDEWVRFVGSGEVRASLTDETKGPKGGQRRNQEMLFKRQGQYEAQCSLIRTKNAELNEQLKSAAAHLQTAQQRSRRPDLGQDLEIPLGDSQKNAMSEIFSAMRNVSRLNRELERAFRELERYKEEKDKLASETSSDFGQESTMDDSLAVSEMGTIRQMAKLCVGRQGNHFPLLYKPYFRGSIYDMCTRETTINILADVEYLDPGIFLRTFKQQTNRIVPNIVLIPCYGEMGICWEPFDRFNRATSRGRLAIPMYPKEPKLAVIAALGDLRWQVAKEKAAHYWMEEGLTGWYYQWFTDAKMKGDVRQQFIQDYILWITKESEGTQKLERDVRSILWRYTPFPQEVKDKLKNRGFVYNELCKKDHNRSISDGY